MREGWEVKRFIKCVNKVTYTNKIKRKDFLEKGVFPIISQEKENINGYWDSSNDVFRINKPVVVFGDHTKIIKYIDFDFVLGADGVKIFETIDSIDSRYFYYFLMNIDLGDLGYARHFRLLKEEDVVFPKLISEQKRIVAKLDKAFETIDIAKANAEKNLQNARDLFESYLNGVFEKKGEDWEEKSIFNTADIEYGFTDKSKNIGEFRYVRITDIDKNGKLKANNKKYISFSTEANNFKLVDKDLLVVRTGATYAKVLYYNNVEPSIFASYLIRVKFKVNLLNKLFWYFSKTHNYWDQVQNLVSGAAQPQFNGNAIKKIIFSYPKSRDEQKLIIKKFDLVSDKCMKLEEKYHKKIDDLEELKKSLLEKAFNGEL